MEEANDLKKKGKKIKRREKSLKQKTKTMKRKRKNRKQKKADLNVEEKNQRRKNNFRSSKISFFNIINKINQIIFKKEQIKMNKQHKWHKNVVFSRF